MSGRPTRWVVDQAHVVLVVVVVIHGGVSQAPWLTADGALVMSVMGRPPA